MSVPRPASTMNSVTVLEDDNYAAEEVPIHQEKGKTSALESFMSSEQRRKLADISNLQDNAKQENMTLMKALAHRNKIIELSGVEFQKLRINLRNVQEKNLQLAQANSHMLAELNTNRDRLKLLQHELGCKNVLLKARKMQLEASYPAVLYISIDHSYLKNGYKLENLLPNIVQEQALPCTHHASKDKVPLNVSDGDCKLFQAHDINHKDTKRKRTSRIKPSESSNVKPIQVKENANSKRKVSGVIDTTGIPEVACQIEDDTEKEVVSQGGNQIVDNIFNKKFVLDAANPVKDSVHSKRQCVRRKSTRFDVQKTEQTEKLLEMDDATETKESARLSLKRRSARLRPEEAEPYKSFPERDEVGETIKRRRVSSRRQSAMFDFQAPEVTVTGTLNADDAGSVVSDGSRSEAVEPSESSHDTKVTNGERRVSTRRQSTKNKSETATDTDGAIKEIATEPSMRINIVQECVLRSSSVSQEDHERETKNKPRGEETEGMMRRTSVGRPSRHAAEKVQSYREVSLKRKMRRN
ncbi:unnamed protein product [Thlaspi arvense]|uniref:Shugoshin C-terminal domain-containing protein n=1 Tax=Thlaspi arvense TaxID=13288 RepID=A0AAU9SZ32_THLAR|nr:unnamed protein product [Thlaspi arvense]